MLPTVCTDEESIQLFSLQEQLKCLLISVVDFQRFKYELKHVSDFMVLDFE